VLTKLLLKYVTGSSTGASAIQYTNRPLVGCISSQLVTDRQTDVVIAQPFPSSRDCAHEGRFPLIPGTPPTKKYTDCGLSIRRRWSAGIVFIGCFHSLLFIVFIVFTWMICTQSPKHYGRGCKNILPVAQTCRLDPSVRYTCLVTFSSSAFKPAQIRRSSSSASSCLCVQMYWPIRPGPRLSRQLRPSTWPINRRLRRNLPVRQLHLCQLTKHDKRVIKENKRLWASECPDVKNCKWRLNPVWHRMLLAIRYDTIEEFNVDSKAEYTA